MKSISFNELKSDFIKAEKIVYNICLKQLEELFMKEVEKVYEELKYYTPDREDISIGYEYELYHQEDGWKKVIFSAWENFNYDSFIFCLKNNEIRTPYLTKEQIEAEGWIFKTKSVDLWFESDAEKASNLQDFYGYKCYKLFLNYGLHDNKLKIKADFTGGSSFDKSDTLFEGFCPSLNELRLISKLLKIC